MKIINPLYDQAFKYLMENKKFARKALSIILDTEVLEVILEQQETIATDRRKLLNVFRMDFKAIIREADGSRKTVLIEVQKSRHSTDIGRFRNYLGTNYMSTIDDVDVVQEPLPDSYSGLPIISIYILGYNLPDLPYLAVAVNPEVVNACNKEKLIVKSYFIEHLTHRSFILQVRRLPGSRRTRLEKFLTFFNQEWCTKEKYILDMPQVPHGFNEMAMYMQSPLLDDAFRRTLRFEEELNYIFDEQDARHKSELAQAACKINTINNQLDTVTRKFAMHLKRTGETNEAIVRETGLTPTEVDNLEN